MQHTKLVLFFINRGYGNTKERMMAFRECFSRIGELRSLVPDITTILALTATATQKTMEMVKSVLSLKSDNYTVNERTYTYIKQR